MIIVVDKANGQTVQKVTKPDGRLVRYQVVPAEHIGDAQVIKVFTSLAAARAAIGKTNGGKNAVEA